MLICVDLLGSTNPISGRFFIVVISFPQEQIISYPHPTHQTNKFDQYNIKLRKKIVLHLVSFGNIFYQII